MAEATAPSKPIPDPNEPGLEPFWQGTLEGKLMLKRCTACGEHTLPYREICDNCLAEDLEWVQASGRGTVATWGVMHQKYHPGWAAVAPYNITIVDLEEGPRIPSNMVGIDDTSQIRIGMPVVVDWERHEDLALPKFRPA